MWRGGLLKDPPFNSRCPPSPPYPYPPQEAGLLHTLRLLHFHVGSQIPTISVIKAAMREASAVYVELARLGAPMGYIDGEGGGEMGGRVFTQGSPDRHGCIDVGWVSRGGDG